MVALIRDDIEGIDSEGFDARLAASVGIHRFQLVSHLGSPCRALFSPLVEPHSFRPNLSKPDIDSPNHPPNELANVSIIIATPMAWDLNSSRLARLSRQEGATVSLFSIRPAVWSDHESSPNLLLPMGYLCLKRSLGHVSFLFSWGFPPALLPTASLTLRRVSFPPPSGRSSRRSAWSPAWNRDSPAAESEREPVFVAVVWP